MAQPRKKQKQTFKYNPHLMPDQVKSKRTSVKFTESEMKEIEEVLPYAKRHGATDKMNMLRVGILRYVRELKHQMEQAENDVTRRPPPTEPEFPLTVRQQADILGFKGRYGAREIAQLVGVPLQVVKQVLGEG